ncbi:hypothetical protein CK203_068262 [Vitis vinifera]|uniref:Reverse transcriptase domain-containing protein n=1 Tax=Vitis vinifera TaxID=29760 RepID=A0A438E1G6_VITVI|nr:hypothetical protein CK203_068262 [Vitis vinifera]
MSTPLVRSLGVGRFLAWGAVEARSQAGGHLGVYGLVLNEERENFWNELGDIRGLRNDPWRFSEVIDDLDLKDLPLSGGRPYLDGPVSDHSPILLDGGGVRTGKIPFRFENMWLKVDGFKELIRGWWEGYIVQGSFSHILAVKLSTPKHNLKAWNREVFGNVSNKKVAALSQLGIWDAQERERSLFVEEREIRRGVVEDFKYWADLEEISWRQKSRELWLQEGDKNTSFFHKVANARRRRNFLAKLRVNGVLLTEEVDIKERVAIAFQSILSDSGNGDLPLVGWTLLLYLALMLKLWRFLSLRRRSLLPFLARMGIKLLGQMAFPWPFGRPVSLVGSLYKLLAKVLAICLTKVVGNLVSVFQHAFVAGRQILDAFLIANEAIDSRMKANLRGVICKLDIEKAYDHVNWNFILAMLEKMGFGFKWISWVRRCIITARFSVLANRSPQTSFKVLGAYDKMTHCLLIYSSWKEVLEYLSWILMWFEAMSGLKINLEKSEPIGEVLNLEDLVGALGCKEGFLPSTYLGLPLGAPFKSSRVLDGVEERF